MSKRASIAAILAIAVISVSAYAHGHLWQKLTQQQGTNGQVVCQWKCGIGNSAHYTTTSGYGVCPQPW